MTSTPEVIEGEVTDEHAVAIPESRNLVANAPDPNFVLRRAMQQADALAGIIEKKRLYASIQGRKHVLVEGWTTLGALNDLWPFTESVSVNRDEDGNLTALAIVSARTGSGQVIARAEGFCSTKETRWKGRDEYAVRSMAQTRGTSKVFRQALSWVMVLSGFEATPAEEMPEDRQTTPATGQVGTSFGAGRTQRPAPGPPQHHTTGLMGEEQRATINDLRMKPEHATQTQKAQEQLKSWGFNTWAKFLVNGTALQAAEVEEALRGGE
jgi:hypothetical protein